MLNNISIGLFIDGGYFQIASQNAYHKEMYLNVGKLLKFCKKYLANHFNIKEDDCQITEKHYYRGRHYAKMAKERDLLDKERKFEDSLISEDVVFHYKHLRTVDDTEDVIEKGIDVWFALETYEISIARDLDIVVIFTGDGDHEMLLNKIKALKKKAVLLTWNFGTNNAVSKLLSEEATLHIELSTVLSEKKEYRPYFTR